MNGKHPGAKDFNKWGNDQEVSRNTATGGGGESHSDRNFKEMAFIRR